MPAEPEPEAGAEAGARSTLTVTLEAVLELSETAAMEGTNEAALETRVDTDRTRTALAAKRLAPSKADDEQALPAEQGDSAARTLELEGRDLERRPHTDACEHGSAQSTQRDREPGLTHCLISQTCPSHTKLMLVLGINAPRLSTASSDEAAEGVAHTQASVDT
jgi:hypothetical protein